MVKSRSIYFLILGFILYSFYVASNSYRVLELHSNNAVLVIVIAIVLFACVGSIILEKRGKGSMREHFLALFLGCVLGTIASSLVVHFIH